MDACLLFRSEDLKKSGGNVLLAVGVVINYNDFSFLLLQDFYDSVTADVAKSSGPYQCFH